MGRLIDEEETFQVLSAYYKHRTQVQDSALHDALSKVPTAETDLSGYSDRLWKLAYNLAYEKGKANAARRGKWIEYPDCLAYSGAYDSDWIVCSECGKPFNLIDNCTEEFNYCPNCGAKMDAE